MPKRTAQETAYYLNGKIPAVALIAKGVGFPAGTWIRIAYAAAVPRHIEETLRDTFPALKGKVITFTELKSESAARDFERSHPSPR